MVDRFEVSFMRTGELQKSSSASWGLLGIIPVVRARERSRPTSMDMRCRTSALEMLISSSVRKASGDRFASGCGSEVVREWKYSGKPVSRSRKESRDGESDELGMVSDDDQPWTAALWNVFGLRISNVLVCEAVGNGKRSYLEPLEKVQVATVGYASVLPSLGFESRRRRVR
jgi:hypothetical protein